MPALALAKAGPSPGARRRAAADPIVVAILAPPPPEPDADLNAKQQRPKAAKQITNDKFSMTNSQWILSHECGEVSKKKAMAFAFSAPSTPARYAGLGVWSPSSKLFSSLSSFLVPSAAMTTTFQQFPLFPFFQPYFQVIATQRITPNPLRQSHLQHNRTASPLARLFNY